MMRIVFFLCCMVGIVILFSFSHYKKFEILNEKFIFSQVEEKYLEKKSELLALREKPKEKIKASIPVAKIALSLETPTLVRGHELYKKCIMCHGKFGRGKPSQGAPHIGGQYGWYIEEVLHAMKNKVRINKVMEPYLKKLNADNFKDLAHYIERLDWPQRK